MNLRELLQLEAQGETLFLARTPHVPGARIYGGQLVAQSLAAAARTVATARLANSLHLYFLRGARQQEPVEYRVTAERDGRAFSVRRVEAWQNGTQLTLGMASFQERQQGLEHQADMPLVPEPERLASFREKLEPAIASLSAGLAEFWRADLGFDVRPVEPFVTEAGASRPPVRHFWIRATGDHRDATSQFHRVALAFISDLHLLETGLLPHGLGWTSSSTADASLDHSMWFYDDARCDEWLLYAMDSPRAAGGRILARGSLFSRDGRLVAVTTQEGTLRVDTDRAST